MNTAVKICGITNVEDALVAVDAGADLLGFILYPKSPRYVEPDLIAEVISTIKERDLQGSVTKDSHDLRSSRASHPTFVGVFVNEPLVHIRQVLTLAKLDYAQLHGDEEPEMLSALAGQSFKVLRPETAEQAMVDAKRFAVASDVNGPKLLVDAYDPQLYGGTGKKTDWTVAAELARRYPGFMLSGGLDPENVANAVSAVQPWGVDVASGVEASPGRKDHEKVRQFIKQAKQAH